ncbi:unnamed protein product [Camellia sinensis]
MDSPLWGEVPVSTRHDTGAGVRSVSDSPVLIRTRLFTDTDSKRNEGGESKNLVEARRPPVEALSGRSS